MFLDFLVTVSTTYKKPCTKMSILSYDTNLWESFYYIFKLFNPEKLLLLTFIEKNCSCIYAPLFFFNSNSKNVWGTLYLIWKFKVYKFSNVVNILSLNAYKKILWLCVFVIF